MILESEVIMTEKEAILARHSVRKYTNKAIDAEVEKQISDKVAEVNAESGLHFQFLGSVILRNQEGDVE